jgi:radical SAM superfamily enzyme YgiQ (UPF0313 family)
MTPYFEKAYHTIVYLKKNYPQSIIVAGGPHATIAPEDTLKRLPVSFCLRGEGEVTFYHLVKGIYEEKDISSLKGISFFDPHSQKIIHNKDPDPLPDIDQFPFPARALLPMDLYIKGGTQKTFSYKKIRATTIITSRGCPYNCSFCQPTIRCIFGNKVRFRSVDNVIEEIEFLERTYGIQGLFILDDTFTWNKKFVFAFCEEILKRKIHLTIAINSRVDTIDEDILPVLKKAGVGTIMYGIESGNQEILDNLKKRITIEQIKKAVNLTKKNKINVYGYFMIGSPLESLSTLLQTFYLALRLPFDEIQFSMAAPYFGTHLFRQVESSNLLTAKKALETDGYFTSAAMDSHFLTSRQIKGYYRFFDLYAKFKSLKNLIIKNPGALSSLIKYRILKKWDALGYGP